MHHAPEQKSPSGAMPQAAEKIDDHNIDTSPDSPFPAAAQRNVQIPGKKTGQCHMPPFPELYQMMRLIRREKIHRQLNPEHQSDPSGHITVTAEIKI